MNHWVVVLYSLTMQTVCPHKQVAAIARSHLGDTMQTSCGITAYDGKKFIGNFTCCVILSQ